MEAMVLNLDGCHITLCGERAKVTLTWRGWLPQSDQIRAFKVEVEGQNALIEERCQAQGATGVRPWPGWKDHS